MAGGGKGTPVYKQAQKTRRANARAATKAAASGTDYMGKQRAAVAAKAAAVAAMPKGGGKAASIKKGGAVRWTSQKGVYDVMAVRGGHALIKSRFSGGQYTVPIGNLRVQNGKGSALRAAAPNRLRGQARIEARIAVHQSGRGTTERELSMAGHFRHSAAVSAKLWPHINNGRPDLKGARESVSNARASRLSDEKAGRYKLP